MTTFTHRYFVKIKFEALTPLIVGSGDSSFLIDALVQKDHLDLPMIPGTAIAGVLRHALQDGACDEEEEKLNDIFGHKNGSGSRLLFSHGNMLLSKLKVAEGINVEIEENLKNKLTFLPIRQHVKINQKGTAVKNNLFNHEVVYKGISFVSTIELKGTKNDKDFWKTLLQELYQPIFRVGQGTRNGFGNLKAEILEHHILDLTQEDDFETYLKLSPSLQLHSSNQKMGLEKIAKKDKKFTHYSLKLEPDNIIDGATSFSTFIFGDKVADKDADAVTKTEEIIEYDDQHQINFSNRWLIPSTSIKGAISHRISYHYNKLKEQFINEHTTILEEDTSLSFVNTDNEAVYILFGCENNMQIDENKEDTERRIKKEGRRGIVLIDDIYLKIKSEKIFNHVAIDRFTGGAKDGALFSEKVAVYEKQNNDEIVLNIYIENEKLLKDILKHNIITNALEKTLIDICKGYLPLGGMTTKGHGFFNGELMKDNITIYPAENEK